MRIITPIIAALALVIFAGAQISAQNYSLTKKEGLTRIWEKPNGSYYSFFNSETNNESTEFNFFMGDDREHFATTLKGFGSMGSNRNIAIAEIGNRNFALFLNLGYTIRYYRFRDNLLITKTEDGISTQIVEDPPYEFKNTFFSWSKNKMVVGYLTIPAGFDLKFKPVDIRFQASYNIYLSGKHKLKYRTNDDSAEFESNGKVFMGFLVGDSRQKYKTPNKEFRDYYINKTNASVSVAIFPKRYGERKYGFGFRYDLKPFFEEGNTPQINAASVFIVRQ